MAAKGIRIQAFQDLGTGKVGEIARACPIASVLERAVFVLAEPEYYYPVSRLSGHLLVGRAILPAAGFQPALAA